MVTDIASAAAGWAIQNHSRAAVDLRVSLCHAVWREVVLRVLDAPVKLDLERSACPITTEFVQKSSPAYESSRTAPPFQEKRRRLFLFAQDQHDRFQVLPAEDPSSTTSKARPVPVMKRSGLALREGTRILSRIRKRIMA